MINIKKISKIVSIYIFLLVIIWLFASNYWIFEKILNKKCDTLEKNDIELLNLYFKNTNYNWDYDYWCDLKKIESNWDELKNELPNWVYKLKNLKFLIVKNSQLTKISSNINNLNELRTLDLSNNYLTWAFFDLNLKKLEFLNLSWNKLNLKKNNFKNLPKLEYFNISWNTLE